MNGFTHLLRARLHPGAWALLVIIIVFGLQQILTDNIAFTKTTPSQFDQFISDDVQNLLWKLTKFCVLGTAIYFWLANQKKWLRSAILVCNILLTIELCSSVFLLVTTLGSTAPAQLTALIKDTVIVMFINVLIFSLWYWLIDAPTIRQVTKHTDEPYDFLFPQRANQISGYEKWQPWYPDYLFLAIITTTTFGPADTLPLTSRAKMLMALQVIIAFLTLSLLAGRALALMGT